MAGDCSSDGEKSGEATDGHGFFSSTKMLYDAHFGTTPWFLCWDFSAAQWTRDMKQLQIPGINWMSWTQRTKKFFLNPIFSEYPKGTKYRKIQGIP